MLPAERIRRQAFEIQDTDSGHGSPREDMKNTDSGPIIAETEEELELVLAPMRRRLASHPMYQAIRDEPTLRTFMTAHVFAVWDFQSLLKALQRLVTCVDVPWLPTTDPQARRLVNEIVLDEESDQAPDGGFLSHFEIYLQAMHESGADTKPILSFMARLRHGTSVEDALQETTIPAGIRSFVGTTMDIVGSWQAHRIAAAFAYGREEIIPSMFRQLIEKLSAVSPHSWETLRYYLDRHIGQDSEQHGPQAKQLVRKLCGHDRGLWDEAIEAAKAALGGRILLWDQVARSLEEAHS